ncbi:Bax inhibitor 1 [Tetrabaena socialis]|uniref:Bax inhibitor 1 n=1 Tax=Tetrabaena socialis TaxID=47790 RepID=A0A2J8A2C1_9CHLO|nr:Bax inhibitor 1 [Tetrabaena socialis]|eukprot:PNH06663.1 Bax inhibitor 1 [Tetrabaena socialis]
MAATAYHYTERHEHDFDVEKGAALNAFAERTVRQGFVKKVFGLLAAQLALTTLIAGAIVLSSTVKAFVAANPWVFMLSFVVSFSIILSFTFSTTARQSHPLNLVLLFAFTAAEGVLVGAASAQVSTDIVLLALGITAGITAGMCLYALTTKHDITMAGSFLYAGLMALIFASLAGFFLKTSAFNMLVSGGGAVLFSVYIAYDVQMLLGGEHKFAVSPDDYVMGTIAIYLDIINLFLHILRLLSSNNRE